MLWVSKNVIGQFLLLEKVIRYTLKVSASSPYAEKACYLINFVGHLKDHLWAR